MRLGGALAIARCVHAARYPYRKPRSTSTSSPTDPTTHTSTGRSIHTSTHLTPNGHPVTNHLPPNYHTSIKHRPHNDYPRPNRLPDRAAPFLRQHLGPLITIKDLEFAGNVLNLRAKFGATRADAGKDRERMATNGQHVANVALNSVGITNNWPTSGQSWPNLGQLRSRSPRIGRILAIFGGQRVHSYRAWAQTLSGRVARRTWPRTDRVGVIEVDLGPI